MGWPFRNRSDSNRRIEVLQTSALATWLRFPIKTMSFPLPCLTLLHWVRPGIKDAGMRGAQHKWRWIFIKTISKVENPTIYPSIPEATSE